MSVTQPDVLSSTASSRSRTWAWARADALVICAVVVVFAVVVTLTWRKWGSPEIDAGAELTAADRVANGAVPYRDIRYFYGPLGLYELAAAFRLFGTSFTVAFGFGLAQTAAILGTFYALARQWLRPTAAGLTTAILLAIAFSGTAFDFVLPHTNSATTGLLCLLLMLLALARGRIGWAGIAMGLTCLTRPEFAAVALCVVAAFLVGTWRTSGRGIAVRSGVRLLLPGLAIPAVVLGTFAALAGPHRLFLEDLWPVDFIRIAGFKSQADWMPLTAASGVGLVARGAVYLSCWPPSQGLSRSGAGTVPTGAFWPCWSRSRSAASCSRSTVAPACCPSRPAQRTAIESESRHLLIGMSWLPCLALLVSGYAVWRFVRRGSPPLASSWPLDLALVAASLVLALRAYNAFTAEGSYAPYYAAPAVLLLGVLHQRIGERWQAAATPALAALGAVAVGLGAYSLVGLYRDDGATVETARGTYVENTRAAPAIQMVVDRIRSETAPDDSILAAPSDAGLYFMSGRRPALANLMVLPGLLATPAEEQSAIADLRRERVTLAVVGMRDFSGYGFRAFGVDYARVLGQWLDSTSTRSSSIGVPGPPASGTYASSEFRVLRLRSG